MKKVFSIMALAFVAVASVFTYFLFKGDRTCQAVEVNGKIMKAEVKGSGDKTIVMLSGWNTNSPSDDFFPLFRELSKDYRVVVLNYFGYGDSEVTNDERSNENIVQEIRSTLRELNIEPPYILLPQSMSGLYSLYYANNYPSEISGIVGMDMSLPQMQLEQWTEETFEKTKISPESSKLNTSIINQWNKLYDNSKELKDIKYPSNLPVLAFLSTGEIADSDAMVKNGKIKTSWTQMNDNMITNTDIQTKKILEGKYDLIYSQTDEIVRNMKNFIKSL